MHYTIWVACTVRAHYAHCRAHCTHAARKLPCRCLAPMSWACALTLSPCTAAHTRPACPPGRSRHLRLCRDIRPPAMPRLGRDTKLRSRPQASQAMSQHQKECHDTNFRSPCNLRVAMPRAMSQHPNGCQHHGMKIMSLPRTNLVPASATS